MYTLEDIVDKLKGATHFAIFNSTKSFFHVPLDEASKKLIAMLTPIGIFVYDVLAMGLSNATNIFEKCMREIVKDLDGVMNIADDVLVFGVGKEQFQNNVILFLDCRVERDLHFNPDKIQIDVPSVPFFGQTLTKQGLKMDYKKWQVIQQWPTPTNVKELQSFLGSVNYLSKFIPYLSDLRQPLQELLKKESEFCWMPVHDEAFREFKICNSKGHDAEIF